MESKEEKIAKAKKALLKRRIALRRYLFYSFVMHSIVLSFILMLPVDRGGADTAILHFFVSLERGESLSGQSSPSGKAVRATGIDTKKVTSKASQVSFPQAKHVGNPSEDQERFRTSRNDTTADESGITYDRPSKFTDAPRNTPAVTPQKEDEARRSDQVFSSGDSAHSTAPSPPSPAALREKESKGLSVVSDERSREAGESKEGGDRKAPLDRRGGHEIGKDSGHAVKERAAASEQKDVVSEPSETSAEAVGKTDRSEPQPAEDAGALLTSRLELPREDLPVQESETSLTDSPAVTAPASSPLASVKSDEVKKSEAVRTKTGSVHQEKKAGKPRTAGKIAKSKKRASPVEKAVSGTKQLAKEKGMKGLPQGFPEKGTERVAMEEKRSVASPGSASTRMETSERALAKEGLHEKNGGAADASRNPHPSQGDERTDPGAVSGRSDREVSESDRPASQNGRTAEEKREVEEEKAHGKRLAPGIPVADVLLLKDIRIDVLTRKPEMSGLSLRLLKRAFSETRRRNEPNPAISVEGTEETEGTGTEGGVLKRTFSVANGEKGIYTFIVENRGDRTLGLDIVFRLYEKKMRERTKEYRAVTVSSHGVVRFRFVLPNAVFWDDEEFFSGNIEDSDSITKFHHESGLVWKEEKDH